MSQFKEAQQAGRGLRPVEPPGPGADAQAQSDTLLERAQEAQTEQTALLEATPVESQYAAAFAALVEAKHDQAERIENRLEVLVEQQGSRLQQTQSGPPTIISLPGSRAKWQQKVAQQQTAVQRLQGRLERVREIKDGMGIRGARIEELATRKLRAQEPGLAREWDNMLEAQRQHQAVLRKREQDEKKTLERSQREAPGRGVRISISATR